MKLLCSKSWVIHTAASRISTVYLVMIWRKLAAGTNVSALLSTVEGMRWWQGLHTMGVCHGQLESTTHQLLALGHFRRHDPCQRPHLRCQPRPTPTAWYGFPHADVIGWCVVLRRGKQHRVSTCDASHYKFCTALCRGKVLQWQR